MYNKLAVDDNYETPPGAWEVILRYLPKHLVLWDPFHCHGSSQTILEAFGFTTIHRRADYFTYEPAEYDLCLTNPPFSKKKEVLARALELGKPFALVLPVATLSCRYFAQLLADDDSVRIIIPLSRLQFLKDRKQTKSCSFSTMFVTRGLNQYLQCPRQIMYVDNSGPNTPKLVFETDRTPLPVPSIESLGLDKLPVEPAYDPSPKQATHKRSRSAAGSSGVSKAPSRVRRG